jgi:fumarylacetoacetase
VKLLLCFIGLNAVPAATSRIRSKLKKVGIQFAIFWRNDVTPAGCPMTALNETHDPKRKSWVASAEGHRDFPIQNLPLGVFSPPQGELRGGVAIGDAIFDLRAGEAVGLFSGAAQLAAVAAAGPTLNPLMALGQEPRIALRKRLSELLSADSSERKFVEGLTRKILHHTAGCAVHMPAAIGNYTDFFAGIHHAVNASRMFGMELPPNYKHLPIAYHGRASSVLASGSTVRRPSGQYILEAGKPPIYGPCQMLDHEFEFGAWIGPGNGRGDPTPISRAENHIFGFCLLNDWSARDIQAWEMLPLGPFLSKNFATTISPWIVTPEALAPFRTAQSPRAKDDPEPLPYLWDDNDQRTGALDIELEASLLTPSLAAEGRVPHQLSIANTKDLYWTFAQMVAHHMSSGCNLVPGDLLGSGTISGPTSEGCGSLLELTQNGKKPIDLASGETRTYLENGDEVIFRATCRRTGYVPIGFGECRGRILRGG